jgi:ABC-type uncharacterized transport system substrate-binding protein
MHSDLLKRREFITLLAVYPGRYSVTAGGLISYGPDLIDQFRRAAGYVDRILRGEKPADLPVQAPTKYEIGGWTLTCADSIGNMLDCGTYVV